MSDSRSKYLPANNLNVKYKNELNRKLDIQKLNPTEQNVLMSLFSTLKDQEDREISIGFDKFREMANVSSKDFTNEELKPLIETTLSKIGSQTIHLENDNISAIFPLFDKIIIDKTRYNITYRVSELFKDYFNYFVKEYVSFPLIDFVKIKGKYTKNLYKILMQFKNTGVYQEDYEEFLYKVMGAPTTLKVFKGANQIVKPATQELKKIGYFQELEFSFTKNNKKIKNIIFNFKVATPNPESLKIIKDDELRASIKEKEEARQRELEETIRIAKTPWIE